MRKQNRVFGNNLKYWLHQEGIDESDFANELGYSDYELQKIIGARLIIDQTEKQEIAAKLGKKLEEMYLVREPSEYEAVGCMECRGDFSDEENRTKVLDLFDVYCDVQETLALEKE